jgi:hypothetical protein
MLAILLFPSTPSMLNIGENFNVRFPNCWLITFEVAPSADVFVIVKVVISSPEGTCISLLSPSTINVSPALTVILFPSVV